MLFDHGTDFIFVTSRTVRTLHHRSDRASLLPLLIVVAFSQYVLDSYYLSKQKQLRMSFPGALERHFLLRANRTRRQLPGSQLFEQDARQFQSDNRLLQLCASSFHPRLNC